MATGREIITTALRKLNAAAANAPPTAEDIDVGLEALNAVIDSKSNQFLNIHTIRSETFLLTPGKSQYALGPTGDWVTTRPVRVQKTRLLMNPVITTVCLPGPLGPEFPCVDVVVGIDQDQHTVNIPVNMVSDEEFASIRMRGVTNALPTTVLDNGGYPNRQLYFWPVPNDGTKAIELWVWEPLEILDLDEELNLPPGYERYYVYALALELCDTFGKRPTREIVASLAEAESAIKILNQIDFRVQPSSPALELNRSNRAYNIIDFRSGAAMLPRSE